LQDNTTPNALLEKMREELEQVKEAPQIDFNKLRECFKLQKNLLKNEKDTKN